MIRVAYIALALIVIAFGYMVGGFHSAVTGAISFILGFLLQRYGARQWPWRL